MGERDCLLELQLFRDDMIEDLMQRLRDGKIIPRNLNTQQRSNWRGMRRGRAAFSKVLVATGRKGIGHVGEELKRQRDGV